MGWKIEKLGKVLTHRKLFITIDNSVEYKRCRVQVNRKGVVLRDVVKGIAINTKKQQVCHEGDFLVAEIDAKVGGYGFVGNDLEGAIVSSHYFLFEVDESKMLKDYLAWLIKTDIIQEQISSKGSTNYAAIRPQHVLDFEIPLPSVKEQLIIVDKLNRINTKYTILSNELNNQQTYLHLLRQTILQEAVQGKLTKQDSTDEPATELLKRIKVEKEKLIKSGKLKKENELPPITEDEVPFELPEGWVWCRLGEIINLKSGVTLGKSYTGDLQEVPYLRVANVQRGFIDITHLKTINVPKSEVEKCHLEKGDLCMIEGGDWDKVGRCAIWNSDISLCIHQNHIFRLRFYGSILNHYGEFYLNSPIARRYFESCSKQTTNLASINKTQLTNLVFPLPSVSEQYRIVTKFQEIQQELSQLETQVQQSRQYTQQLLQSVLKDVFVQKENAEEIEELNVAAEPVESYHTSEFKHHSQDKLHAMLLVKIIETHNQQPKYLPTLGRVKSEKTCHIIENQLEINLGREPLKDAAGPVDFKHLLEVERLANKLQWFETKQKKIKGKVDFIKGRHFDEALNQASETFKEQEESIDRIINLFLPLDTEQTEIIATAYAAWNNLILIQASFIDEDIVIEARENWAEEKLRYSKFKFQQAIDWLRVNQLIPAGKGKMVKSKM